MMHAQLKRLAIRDRFVTVLKAITDDGEVYFRKPYDVERRLVTWDECGGFPMYAVFITSGGRIEEMSDHGFDEIFYIDVIGYCQNEKDVVSEVEYGVHDVRTAIEADFFNQAAGSLGSLCVNCKVDGPPETDDGELSIVGQGMFSQRFEVTVFHTGMSD